MHHRSSISLRKLFSRLSFGRVTKPKSPFSRPSLIASSSQGSSHDLVKMYHHFYPRKSIFLPTHITIFQDIRHFSHGSDKELDDINLKFAEAREEIESAMESKETVYFNEEAYCARKAVNEVLDMYDGLLRKLPESEKAAIQRAMGLKMEQLKAEIQQLDE